MQQRTTNGIGKRLDEVKLVLPIDVMHKCSHVVDVDGMVYGIRLDGLGEISLKLDIDRELVAGNPLFVIDAMEPTDTKIVQA